MVPQDGFILIDIPNDIKFNASQIISTATCATTVCSLIGERSVKIQTTQRTEKGQTITIKLGGFKNARSFKPSDSFSITTYDTDGVSAIDEGYNQNVATSIASEVTSFKVSRRNFTNGAIDTYNFTLLTDAPIIAGDVLTFSFPPEVEVNANRQTTQCSFPNPKDVIVCGISGNDIQITISSMAEASIKNLTWSMSNIRNPSSVAPSASFSKIVIRSSEDYTVADFKGSSVGVITDIYAANLQSFNLFQDSLQSNTMNNYTITFKPVNPLPATGSIKLIYPNQIQMSDGAKSKCFVTTNKLFASNCQVDTANRTVVITGVFAQSAPYSSEITIMLQNVINPIDNRRFDHDGFDLFTYSDTNQKFIADQAFNIMTPVLNCDYPCATCEEGDRLACTGCWLHTPEIPLQFLMSYSDKPGQCKNECDYNFTSNGSPNKVCTKCDESCNDCYDDRKVNDTQQCVLCANSHPFRLKSTKFCLNTCNAGIFERTLFQTNEFFCDTCDWPCLGCYGDKKFCTSCPQDQPERNLWQNTCIKDCPVGTTSVAGVCKPCLSPCATCEGNTHICKSCDASDGRKLLLNTTCYADCPATYANDFENNKCVGCLSGCDKCNITNQAQCLKCGENLYLLNDTCRGSCPDGYKGVNGVCIPLSGEDLTVLWFPYLIAAVLLTIIVYFAKCKKKTELVNGKLEKINNQSSVAAIIAFIAPLQTLCLITQCVFSAKFGHSLHFVLAAIVIIVIILINILFVIWFRRTVFRKRFARHGETIKLRNGDTLHIRSDLEGRKHQVYADKFFESWYNKHECTFWLVMVQTLMIHFKSSKILYSKFYMFDMYKAKWSKENVELITKKMRTTWFLTSLIAIDLIAIGVSAVGLLSVQWLYVNQLWVTFVESIVLALYLIVLALIENSRLNDKGIMKYVYDSYPIAASESMQKFNKLKGKSLRMQIQLNKVQDNSKSKSFTVRKLQELTHEFGQRRCKSFDDLNTGWDQVDDPRKVKTWPISRSALDAIEAAGIKKFSIEDSMALQDNVYHDSIAKAKGRDKNIQGDAARQEFQFALNRKHGDLMAQLDPEAEMHARKGQKRRGRKNKYHNQIDLEDDQEIDPDEASDQDADLQIIKEQEEEEENLRRMVQASSKQQQEQAQLRHQKLNAAQLSHQQQKERVEAELKLKQQQQEQELKKKQMEEALRLQKENQDRQKLEEEARGVIRQKEEKERLERERLKKESEEARALYDQQEKERLEREKEALLLKQQEEEALLHQEQQRMRDQREQELEKLKAQQQEADQRKLLENQMLQEQRDLQRKQEKEKEKQLLDKEKEDRRKAEEAEKLAKKIAEDKAQNDKLKEKENRKKEEQLRKEQEQKRKEEEIAQKKEIERQEKEARKAKEEEERKARADSKAAEKKQREQPPGSATIAVGKQQPIREDVQPIVSAAVEEQNKEMARKMMESTHEKFMSVNEDDDVTSSIVNVNQNAIQELQQKQDKQLITIPPNSDLRDFNEYDIIGDLDRDEKGNLVILEDKNGRRHDKQRNPVNQRGYLMDPKTNNIVENITQQTMFTHKELDDHGEIPAPFCLERHNFNPHDLMGDFDYQDMKPILMKTNQGFYVDKRGRRVNSHGWFTLANQAHIYDRDGRKKFDRRQLHGEDLHKLYNYEGQRFDIKDVMGQFVRDQNGWIQPQSDGKQLRDNLGRLVNEKGYLIDAQGNIIDVKGKKLWKKTDLKHGEFPKIFPFTKFNIARVQGDIQEIGKSTTDRKGRAINTAGYLVDSQGNVVDIYGKVMFEKQILQPGGDIPEVFKTGLLRSGSASSLSRLMSEIERNNQSEYDPRRTVGNEDNAFDRLKREDGDTSVDSKMEDTPANYNMANQRFDSEGNQQPIPEDEEGGEHMAPSDFSDQDDPAVLIQKKKQKPKKKKKPKMQTIEFLEPTKREKNMAGAYGGVARGEIRRPGIKYDRERLENSKKFRVSTADEPRVRAQLNQLINNPAFKEDLVVKEQRSKHENPEPLRLGLNKDGNSSHSKSMRGGTQNKGRKPKRGINDADFEQMFGKDIDQFLEDSEWDIESQDKVSQGSHASRNSQFNAQKLKAMEKVYLKRMEDASAKVNRRSMGSGSALQMPQKKRKQDVKGPDRETIIAITDDPGVIHRGEILPFTTKKTFQSRI